MYAFKTSRGFLTIRPADATSCELWLNNTRVRECDSANEAARLVAAKRTGNLEIDTEDTAFPTDIDGWHWISVSKPRPPPRLYPRP